MNCLGYSHIPFSILVTDVAALVCTECKTFAFLGVWNAKSSSYNTKSQSLPMYAIDGLAGSTSKPFRSAKEINPWLYIDFENETQIDNVHSFVDITQFCQIEYRICSDIFILRL